MLFIKLALARTIGALSRFLGRGGGTSLPGKILLHLDRRAIEKLCSKLVRGSVIVSATNGKTTTANMVSGVLRRGSVRLVNNSAGANLTSGVATALLESSSLGGKPRAELGLFEVDEAAMPLVADQANPHTFVLSNLFRDQLDRYGELEHVADLWAQAIAKHGGVLVLCADDPLVADLGRPALRLDPKRITYFGIEDTGYALPEMQHAADSKSCRNCGTAYVYDAVLLGHLGHYHCPRCGSKRPSPTVAAKEIVLEGMGGTRFLLVSDQGASVINLPVPGLYNVYNALAAAACCLRLGVSLTQLKGGLEAFSPAFGRVETVELDGRSTAIMLIKNPAGANEVMRTLTMEDDDLDLLIALNDKVADGRDVSWIWDADFELIAKRTRRLVCSGTRAAEMALRLKYAGVDQAKIEVQDDLGQALQQAIRGDGQERLYLLPTYTALLELKKLLSRQGYTQHYWL